MFINEKNNISLMEDILNDVKETIDDINISFTDNKEMNKAKKEEYICELLYTLGYYSYSSYIDFFDMIPEIQQQDYYRCFMIAFCNHYVKSQSTPSSKLIGSNVFFKGWRNFIDKLKDFDAENYPKTKALKSLCCENDVSYENIDSKTNKNKRFWNKYVCYCPTSKSAIVPPISSREGLYQQELPFYYILYTIYYYSNLNTVLDSPFDDFQLIFADSSKVRYFNKILRWCVACYIEWYSFCSIQEFLDTKEDFSYYITGIPYILENFGFFWHIGMEWNYVCLKETLDGYDYNFLTPKLISPPPNNYADFIWALFSTHRLWTQPYITGEDALCQPRKDEKQRSFKENTNYIQKYLDKYFYYQSGKINIDFCFEYSTKKTCLPNGKEIDSIDYTSENILALTQSNIRKFFSSIFLCFADSCNSNDLLPYINLYIYFNFFKYNFKYVEINEDLSLTSYETFINKISNSIEFNHKKNDYLLRNLYDRIIKLKNSKDFTRLMSSSFDIDDNIDYFSIYNSIIVENNLDIFTDLLQRLITDHTDLNYTEIYNNKIESIFLEIKKHALVSDEDIKKEIYKVYLNLIGNDI